MTKSEPRLEQESFQGQNLVTIFAERRNSIQFIHWYCLFLLIRRLSLFEDDLNRPRVADFEHNVRLTLKAAASAMRHPSIVKYVSIWHRGSRDSLPLSHGPFGLSMPSFCSDFNLFKVLLPKDHNCHQHVSLHPRRTHSRFSDVHTTNAIVATRMYRPERRERGVCSASPAVN